MATRKDSRGYALKKGESQRKDGRYVFRYTTLRGEHRSVYAKELSELRKKEVKIRRAIEDGLDPDRAERITLNELFDDYISQKYDLKQSTMTNYKYMYNHYVRDGFGKLRISKIKYSDIKKFYYSLILEKGFKPNSMEIVHTLLHPTFTMAVRDGLLRLNPTEGVMAEIKKSHCWEKTKRHALTVPEQRAFTNYIANSEEYRGWYPLFTVMLGTGCRIGEVLGLRWQDVDFKNRTISINHNLVYRVQEDGTCTNHVNSPKTKAGIRIIPMLDEVFDAFLEEYQYQKVIGFCTDEIDGYSGFVFCTGDGKVYLPNAINRTIRSICADYNKEEESKAKEENRDPVLLPNPAAHILHSLLRERNQPEGHSGNHGSCGYFHHNGCIRRSNPREKERIHDLSAKRIACAVRHRFKITEMFLSAGQRSTSRL